MKTLVLASNNKHKIKEVKNILSSYNIISLEELGFFDDIEENGSSTEENSEIKTRAILDYLKSKKLDYAVIADDSGLFINALNGEPGIYSARYAGNHDDEANRQKVFKNLADKVDRSAYFECNICYGDSKNILHFVGRTYGNITEEKRGSDAFGYDCIFLSDDLGKTFGEATEEEKDSVSHRGRAVDKLKIWLEENK